MGRLACARGNGRGRDLAGLSRPVIYRRTHSRTFASRSRNPHVLTDPRRIRHALSRRCRLPFNPGWPLRNLLALAASTSTKLAGAAPMYASASPCYGSHSNTTTVPRRLWVLCYREAPEGTSNISTHKARRCLLARPVRLLLLAWTRAHKSRCSQPAGRYFPGPVRYCFVSHCRTPHQ